MRRYWMGEVEAAFPRLAGGRAFASVLARRSDTRKKTTLVPVRIHGFRTGSTFAIYKPQSSDRRRPALTLVFAGRGSVVYQPEHRERQGLGLSLARRGVYRFRSAGIVRAACLHSALRVCRARLRGASRQSANRGRYRVAYSYFADSELDRFSFERWEVDVRQYVSFLRGRRVLAFRGLASFSDPRRGHTVPFYLQQWLGGSHSLRGFRDFRLRDRHWCCCRRSIAGSSFRPWTRSCSTMPARSRRTGARSTSRILKRIGARGSELVRTTASISDLTGRWAVATAAN